MRTAKIIIAFIMLLAPASAAFADTITLKAAVRLKPGAEAVTLCDVAELEGDEARRLAQVKIAEPATSQVLEIPVQQVRAKLDAAGANWAKVDLNGRQVIVRPARGPQSGTPLAMTPVALEGAPRPKGGSAEAGPATLGAASLTQEATLRGMIASLMLTQLRLSPDQLRLTFQAEDASFVQTATAGVRLELQPLGSLASDRVEFAVRMWEGPHVRETRTVRVEPEVAASVAELTRDVAKDHVIVADDVRTSSKWLPPSQALLMASGDSVVGRITCKALDAGEALRHGHVRRDALVKKGEQVTVRCLVGGVAISLQAEARADGASGERIEFRKLGERQTFTASVTGRGEAVLDLSDRRNS